MRGIRFTGLTLALVGLAGVMAGAFGRMERALAPLAKSYRA